MCDHASSDQVGTIPLVTVPKLMGMKATRLVE
jgi:hypothetical protein